MQTPSTCPCPAGGPLARAWSSARWRRQPCYGRRGVPWTLSPKVQHTSSSAHAQQALHQLARGGPRAGAAGHALGDAVSSGYADPDRFLPMSSRRSTSSRAEGRALASPAMHCVMRSITSCEHSSGALGVRMRPRRGACCRRTPMLAWSR